MRLFFLGLIAMVLCGCSRPPPCEKYLTEPLSVPERLVTVPPPVNALRQRNYDLCLLHHYGVQTIRMGEVWKLIFPSDDVFENDTAEIKFKYEPVLNVAADFMRTFSKISVKVAGFSDRPPEEIMTKFGTLSDELTTRQAQSVMHYLTCHHINARLIYAVGKGACKPVAWNGSAESRRFNRRIEVTFRYYINNTAWY